MKALIGILVLANVLIWGTAGYLELSHPLSVVVSYCNPTLAIKEGATGFISC